MLESALYTLCIVLLLLQIKNGITTNKRLAFLEELRNRRDSLGIDDFESAILNFEKTGHLKQMFDLTIWTDYQYFPWFYKKQ